MIFVKSTMITDANFNVNATRLFSIIHVVSRTAFDIIGWVLIPLLLWMLHSIVLSSGAIEQTAVVYSWARYFINNIFVEHKILIRISDLLLQYSISKILISMSLISIFGCICRHYSRVFFYFYAISNMEDHFNFADELLNYIRYIFSNALLILFIVDFDINESLLWISWTTFNFLCKELIISGANSSRTFYSFSKPIQHSIFKMGVHHLIMISINIFIFMVAINIKTSFGKSTTNEALDEGSLHLSLLLIYDAFSLSIDISWSAFDYIVGLYFMSTKCHSSLEVSQESGGLGKDSKVLVNKAEILSYLREARWSNGLDCTPSIKSEVKTNLSESEKLFNDIKYSSKIVAEVLRGFVDVMRLAQYATMHGLGDLKIFDILFWISLLWTCYDVKTKFRVYCKIMWNSRSFDFHFPLVEVVNHNNSDTRDIDINDGNAAVDDDVQEVCCICLNEAIQVRGLPCGHYMHDDCLLRFLRSKAPPPLRPKEKEREIRDEAYFANEYRLCEEKMWNDISANISRFLDCNLCVPSNIPMISVKDSSYESSWKTMKWAERHTGAVEHAMLPFLSPEEMSLKNKEMSIPKIHQFLRQFVASSNSDEFAESNIDFPICCPLCRANVCSDRYDLSFHVLRLAADQTTR